jgi:oxygen-independent coproporphyrinogen-3 oxidase
VSAIYVHVPFCARKCLYCDFYSVEDPGGIEPFLAALDREVARAARELPDLAVETIFLGGGTPSLLTPAQVDHVVATLRAAFSVAPDPEITLEANPGTVTAETLKAYRSAGITRLSLGIQSLRDPELRLLGRIHTAADARDAVAAARAAGFDDLSLDLIYAIPGQTLRQWTSNLDEAVALNPEHLSAYALTVERHTPLGGAVQAGRLRPAPPEAEAALFERTMEVMAAAGYEHYEVSNYARPGFRCRHNLTYWAHGDYLGLGPAAHSFRMDHDRRGGRRWWNVADLSEYLARLEAGGAAAGGEERLGLRELLAERILLRLRAGGLDVAEVRTDFGYTVGAGGLLPRLREQGLLVLQDRVLRLTPQGYLVCDEIARRLLPP